MDTKVCQGCEQEKDISEYPLRKDRKNPVRRPYCNACRNDAQRARYSHHKRTQPFKLKTSRAKVRATALGVPFNLDPEYLESIWTGTCPISGIPLHLTTGRLEESAAELDRFEPDKGYVKGNVTFISRRMNRLKNSGSLTELKQIMEWMENYGSHVS
jgi:hypothetical protein